MIKCPVCEQFDFESDSNFQTCDVCGWENDGLQYDDHDDADGANWLSVNQARDNYQKYGVIMTDGDKQRKAAFFAARVAPDGSWTETPNPPHAVPKTA
ncbi:MAG: hypothetical protein FWG38_10230 [Defluviitaleaceae bacterium]|nr:hypothetical protein [Defluviitaleaceae bacterium]